jgi:hypothetical protein
MYAMKVVSSLVFHTMMFTHDGNIITLDNLMSYYEYFCWLWSMIIFLFHGSLLSTMFIPHEDCTPRNIVHPSTQGVVGGTCPLAGSGGKRVPEGKISL